MSKQGSDPPMRATIGKVVTPGRGQKSYVVAYPQQDHGELKTSDSVTFALSKWFGKEIGLHHGQVVELYNVTLFAQGWRAAVARPVTISSKQTRST